MFDTDKPAIGTPVMLAGGWPAVGVVTAHPGMYPQFVAVTTEQQLRTGGTPRLVHPAQLVTPGPAEAWNVHVLQALVNTTERTS